jgi:hypothetical protein
MKTRYVMMAFALTVVIVQLGFGQTADVEKMKSVCSARAAKALGVTTNDVEVKYEGQRVDKTHAVNGSATVRNQDRTFQCSFVANGSRIARFVLNPAPRGGGAKSGSGAAGADNSAERAARGEFNATGPIPCAQFKGQPMGQCDMGVARSGGGTATVSITFPDGHKRAIFFKKGVAVGADTSQAEGKKPFRVSKKGDLYLIQVGDERYEIAEVVIFGD